MSAVYQICILLSDGSDQLFYGFEELSYGFEKLFYGIDQSRAQRFVAPSRDEPWEFRFVKLALAILVAEFA